MKDSISPLMSSMLITTVFIGTLVSVQFIIYASERTRNAFEMFFGGEMQPFDLNRTIGIWIGATIVLTLYFKFSDKKVVVS